jgi:hypothetical protein
MVCAIATAALILHTDEQVLQHTAAAVGNVKNTATGAGQSAVRRVQQGICRAQRLLGGEL